MITETFACRSGDVVAITLDESRDSLLTDFGVATLRDRYLLPGETPQRMFARVAAWYGDDAVHAQRVYDAISQLWFMPATPVLSNGGAGRGLPISCFLNSVTDSMPGIAGIWNENVHLGANGGGIGTYWGNVRSVGERVGINGYTSGIVPFIHVMDSMTLAVNQGSLRRGTAAVFLPVDHPEIEEFIELRRPTGGDIHRKAMNIHHGVVISDAFMKAVMDGSEFDLISPKSGEVIKSVPARDLMVRMLHARLETGEPYMVFSDTVKRLMPEVQKRLGLNVVQSNLCVEITLPTGIDHLGNDRTAVCCLSSLNLETYDQWKRPDIRSALIHDVLLFLDNVMSDFIDKTEHKPEFAKARYSAMRERSVGLGVMGFHSYLQAHNVPFESALAKSFNRSVFKAIHDECHRLNVVIGEERGPCPDATDAGLSVRFSNMTAIAPTASISIIAGNASPGIEPLSANAYTQKTLAGSFSVRNKYLDKIITNYVNSNYPEEKRQSALDGIWSSITVSEGSVAHLDFLSDDTKMVYRTAQEMDQRWIIEHAADRAPLIDQAQSVNLFLPATTHKRDLFFLHMEAWKKGLKSLYYLRSTSVRSAGVVAHMAGTMPTESARPDVVMPSKVDYDECLACQ